MVVRRATGEFVGSTETFGEVAVRFPAKATHQPPDSTFSYFAPETRSPGRADTGVWHPAGVRDIWLLCPGVSLRSTPG